MPPRPRKAVLTDWYVADRPLPVGKEMGAATMPVRAFNPGDRVPGEHVEKYGWHDYVHPLNGTGGTPPGETEEG